MLNEIEAAGGEAPAPEPKGALERRAVLRRFGTCAAYAAYTAPALTVLLSSRQSQAGSFGRGQGHGKSAGKAHFSS